MDDLREPVPMRRYRPATPSDGAVVWFHGGGWTVGDLDGFDRVCRSLCNASGLTVVSVDYRLAPEHPYPAALEDAVAAARWAEAEHGPVVLGGDSAGGLLVVLAAQQVPVRGQLLVYPALDPSMDSSSYSEFRHGPLLTHGTMAACWDAFLGDAALPDLVVGAPPPTAVALAAIDPLRDDGLRYAEAARAAGGQVDVRVWEDMGHGFLRWGGVVDAGGELVAWLAGHAKGFAA